MKLSLTLPDMNVNTWHMTQSTGRQRANASSIESPVLDQERTSCQRIILSGCGHHRFVSFSALTLLVGLGDRKVIRPVKTYANYHQFLFLNKPRWYAVQHIPEPVSSQDKLEGLWHEGHPALRWD